jgi:DNA topoisomerase-3
MGSDRTMQVAEALYQRGILSYPRTETDFFKEGFDLTILVEEHRSHSIWGAFASDLLDNNKFTWPRNGGHDDQAHPPIHPTRKVELAELTDPDEKKIYELVSIHFLACCAQDARGDQTTIGIEIPHGGESFSATGLMIIDRAWLAVYNKYEKWSAKKVPVFQIGDTFPAKKLQMTAGKYFYRIKYLIRVLLRSESVHIVWT